MDIGRWERRVAIVTGASAGIGAAICKTLVKNSMIVIGCARRLERLEQLSEECRLLDYKGELVPYKCDLRKDSEIEAMFAWIKSNHGGVDVCVNNAGLSTESPLLECSIEQLREMVDVNVLALTLCSKLAVKSMMERSVNDGHIFMINSMSGHRLTGKFNFYACTKFAVTALVEGFRRELVEKSSRIRVTGISPGVVETEFLNRTLGEVNAKAQYKAMPRMTSQDIADALVYALSTPENVQVHDIQLRPTGTKI
jgi:NADP-dependent 3-hydroxy acid dehydrogenase YdfG